MHRLETLVEKGRDTHSSGTLVLNCSLSHASLGSGSNTPIDSPVDMQLIAGALQRFVSA